MNPFDGHQASNTPEKIDSRIYAAIRKVKPSLKDYPLTPETKLENLGMQSIERLTVMFELEEAFEVSIVDANLDTFATVAEARGTILKLLAPETQSQE